MNQRIIMVRLAAAALLAAAGITTTAAAPPVPAGIAHRQEAYKTIGAIELKMDVFEPEKKEAEKKYPAIVFFHGGGWSGGTPSQLFPQAQYLASRGMIAFSAEYRVSSLHHTTPVECVKDAKSAVRWGARQRRPAWRRSRPHCRRRQFGRWSYRRGAGHGRRIHRRGASPVR